MRIGLFGGTFDPPHVAHLSVARAAQSTASLDLVIWMTAAEPPHKVEGPFASPQHRLAMTRLAVRGQEGFEASSLEIERAGRSYTVETLEEMQVRFFDDDLYLIIGGDSLHEFHTWREPEHILNLADLIVYHRGPRSYPDVDAAVLESTQFVADAVELQVSSSAIRDRIKSGQPFDHLVPEPVADYIRRHQLYIEG